MHLIYLNVLWAYLIVGVIMTSRILDAIPPLQAHCYSFHRVLLTCFAIVALWPFYLGGHALIKLLAFACPRFFK